MNTNDTLILELLKANDKKAFEFVFEYNYALLCQFARQFVCREQAEEIVDDVLCYLWEHRAELEITYSIRSYLMQSVRNRCIDELRLRKVNPTQSFTSITIEDNIEFLETIFKDDNHPMGVLMMRELEDRLKECIEKMPTECRRVFEKSRFEGKKHEVVAQELNISVNTVKYHIKNALAILQKDLRKYLEWIVFFFLFQN